jgi:hypothetical protein
MTEVWPTRRPRQRWSKDQKDFVSTIVCIDAESGRYREADLSQSGYNGLGRKALLRGDRILIVGQGRISISMDQARAVAEMIQKMHDVLAKDLPPADSVR